MCVFLCLSLFCLTLNVFYEKVIAKQGNIKNPSTNQSSYENLIKGQNKTVWPVSINAFVEVNVPCDRAVDKRSSDEAAK